MKAVIKKSRLCGVIDAPPSKSMAHRLLICAALCGGTSRITGISDSDDVTATMRCLHALGAKLDRIDGRTVSVTGADMANRQTDAQLDCVESGSTLRFLIPLALLSNRRTEFCGSDTLLSRPLSVYERICNEQGLLFCRENGVTVRGVLSPGEYRVEGGISSQFISGLMFALPLLRGDSRIHIIPPIESRPYIDLTMQALGEFGVTVVWESDKTLYIKGGQKYQSCDCAVEGDWSSAAFFSAANVLGGDVKFCGLDPDSLQGDKVCLQYFDMLCRGTPTVNVGSCPDLAPILMAAAAAKSGAVFCGTRRLKIKESDRGEAMAQELKKFGCMVTVHEDSIVVYPAAFHAPDEPLCGHNDHRIVMALSILLTLTGGEIVGAQAVKKSLPEFYEMLAALGGKVKLYDTDG